MVDGGEEKLPADGDFEFSWTENNYYFKTMETARRMRKSFQLLMKLKTTWKKSASLKDVKFNTINLTYHDLLYSKLHCLRLSEDSPKPKPT